MTAVKAAALVDKLVRIARADSGASDAERASAALEACRLISEHDLCYAPAACAPAIPDYRAAWPARPTATSGAQVQTSPTSAAMSATTPYRAATAAYDVTCGIEGCGGKIFGGERCWRRHKNGQVEYVHASCWWES